MHRLNAVFIAAMASAVLTECAPATRFTWGDYENSLYVYYKSPSEREAYRKSLLTAVERGRQKNDIAPGLLAELGYLYMEDGDTARATALFREEMQRFPESQSFLTRVLERSAPMQASGGMS